jgi:type I restriction enzyme M protein
MLDTQTKRRIDDCRDILVGKLPDPKAQIEQITIGLIYKFMDDMDKEAVELGGQAKFFSDYKVPDPEFPNDRNKDKVIEFSKYAWDKLMHPKVTATEMLTLYSEAIEGMEKNPNIPQLFRDIFNNAYLPYRDPETLKLFLKTIGEFEYTHSEKLGDAFEYLLSVMGSQGDAGQFRTPRHIIDFLVAIIDPDKTDTILDPACGTAGFLISAYKHILLKHSTAAMHCGSKNIFTYNQLPDSEKFPLIGDLLTPDDRKKLIQNFVGYDISPDMVRLSLVNLYLHGFNTPNIHEYDTLSSEERWNETFDVVLANPPFMSPKGGIRPHKKFTISSNRSEVLFVDYIAEHLNPNGKSGIIVPEGIIFQSGTAYKDLRKMLVENHLYAVVSLPAGVFNPYSGVKTSILLMDKEVAKTREEILFIKIDNDGYNLGAQRTAVKGSQLEEAIALTHEFVASGEIPDSLIAHAVLRTEIAVNGDYNLTGDRYKSIAAINSHYELTKLSEVCEINPETIEPSSLKTEEFVYIDISSVENGTGRVSFDGIIKISEAPSRARRKVRNNDVLLSTVRPNLKAFGYLKNVPKNAVASTGFAVLRSKEKLNSNFLFYNLFTENMVSQMTSMMGKGAYPSINQKDVASLQIPLPPLSIQEEIVAEIEGYQKIIDGAKAVVANYKPKIDIDPDWEMVELGGLAKNLDGKRVPITKAVRDEGKYPYYGASGIVDYVADFIFDEDLLLISEDGANLLARVTPIAFSVSGKVWVNNHAHVLRFDKMETQKFVEYYLNSISLEPYITGSAQPKLNQKALNSITIPLPDIETQRQIVSQIENEQALVSANKQLIEIFEQKIKDRIAKVWGAEKSKEETMNMAAEPQVEYAKS